MGKFPGKPSKIINRKRIKVSRYSFIRENDSVKAAENIYYGLTVFNETFGTEEQVATDFHGFSLLETNAAVAHARLHQKEIETKCKLQGLNVSLRDSFEQELLHIGLSTGSQYVSPPPPKGVATRTRKQCFDGGGDSDKGAIRRVRSIFLTPKLNHSNNHVGSSTNNAAKKLLQKAKKSSSHLVANAENYQQEKGVSSAIRKFVLPSRSAHSSRVIKPNKRFIEGDELTSDVSIVRSPSAIQLKKPKLILSSLRNSSEHSDSNYESFEMGASVSEPSYETNKCLDNNTLKLYQKASMCSKNNIIPDNSHDKALVVAGKRRWKPSYKVQVKLRELNVFGAGTGRCPFRRNLGSNTGASESLHSSDKNINFQSTNSNTSEKSESEVFGSTGSILTEDRASSNSWSGPKLNGSKVILRKARLKLNTQSSSTNEGHTTGTPGMVECGVCGAVRFYRFVKQARKFGILSCESCRKFISKMIKRQACFKGSNLPLLECHKGRGNSGMCTVPPIVRSQQWKAGRTTMVRCSYKARCPACWLKMCLRSFNMPDVLRQNLIAMLPPQMRIGISMQSSSIIDVAMLPKLDSVRRSLRPSIPELVVKESELLFKGTRGRAPPPNLFRSDPLQNVPPLNPNITRSGKRIVTPVIDSLKKERKEEKVLGRPRNIRVTNKANKYHRLSKSHNKLKDINTESSSEERSKKRKRNGGIKMRKKGEGHLGARGPRLEGPRRQRLDLKGPRVKHVCRSASIVLGQPPATFPQKVPVQPKPDMVKPPVKTPCCLDCKGSDIPLKPQAPDKTPPCHSVPEVQLKVPPAVEAAELPVEPATRPASSCEDSSITQDEPTSFNLSTHSYRKVNNKQTQPSLARMLPVPGKRTAADTQNLVSIDFWESYDPEEVCNTGFGLIGSEPFHIRAMCFLCGSAGHEQLIHCASCCEPYHRFCLEDGLRDTGEVWRCNWICQRCTLCHLCGRGQGQQMSCHRCHRTYHSECLGPDRASNRLHSPDRPWVCASCLRCKSCGVAEVTVFVGNLPLCKGCFKLRQKGNYCPLCQRCYEDHDYDTKMMECGKCSCWVHAKCEGLSDEKYQVLSFLPDSVEFVCRMCCVMPPAPWWIAVEEELKAGYLGVLKSLSKNRKACALLKWSPKKQCVCRSVSIGKRLDFTEHSIGKESEAETSNSKLDLPDRTTCLKVQESIQNKLKLDEKQTVKSQMNVVDEKLTVKSQINVGLMKKVNAPEVACTLICSSPQVEQSQIVTLQVPDTSPFQGSEACVDSSPQEDSTTNESVLKMIPVSSSDHALKQLREKYNLRECSVRVQDCIQKPVIKSLTPVKVDVPCTDLLPDSSFGDSSKSPSKVQQQQQPLATPCSDSGISSTDEELKPCGLAEEAKEHAAQENRFPPEPVEMGYSSGIGEDNLVSESEGASSETCANDQGNKECMCLEQTLKAKPTLTLLSIKKKVNANEYSSLLQFHQEMEHLIGRAQCVDLLEMYHQTLQEVFPWFDPKYARVSSRPLHDDHFYSSSSPRNYEKPVMEENRILESVIKWDDGDQEFPSYMKGKTVDYFYSGFQVDDVRTCTLCKGMGDGLPTVEGRLLYCGQNEWAHTNCALWSAEVFEEIDGSLQNVHSAMSRGRLIRCPFCSKRGASVGCCSRNCAETYHFPCARKAHCTFMDDKNVFCPIHATEAVGKQLHLDSEFDIRRPIYVELDRKKKKFSEVHKVKFMIGSLLVDSLGEFINGASDHPDVIIPSDFRCTRLFWSSVEPWRVVQYHVKTIVQVMKPKPVLDLGKNITVDHTQEQQLVKQKLDEVTRWHQQLDLAQGHQVDESTSSDVSDEQTMKDKLLFQEIRQIQKKHPQKTEGEKVARQVVNYLLDTICNRDVDDNCLSDPQNTADILPPELKDAIFEDLPHDLLDGISMQDIFPKLMSYEDTTVKDLMSDGCFGTDTLKDGKEDLGYDMLNSEVISAAGRSQEALLKGKRVEQSMIELGSQPDLWFQCSDSKDQVQNLVEDFFQNVCAKGSMQKSSSSRELKRSKSEVIPQPIGKKVSGGTRGHQRSCSLTWSCKLDGSVSGQSKRRKGTRTVPRTSGEGASNLVMVVDGSGERAHMLQELRLPDGVLVTLARSTTPAITSAVGETVRELKYRLEDEPSTQADGRRRSTHPKEEGKENKCLLWHGRTQPRLLQLDGTIDSSSSSSEGGTSPRQIDDKEDSFFTDNPHRSLQQNLAPKDQTDEEPVRCNRCHRTYRTRTSFERHLPTCSSDFILSTSESDSENTRSSEEESFKKQQHADPEPQNKKTVVTNQVSDRAIESNLQTTVSVKKKPPPPPNPGPHITSRNVSTQSRPRILGVNGKPRGRSALRFNTQRSIPRTTSSMVEHSLPSQYHQSHSVVHAQSNPSSTGPTVIVQQVPSPNVVPAFVEAFQQQTGQSLQYIATIDAHNNGYNKQSFLTSAPNPLVSGAFQLQASTDGFTGIQNGTIPVMPGVQLASSQPTVLGTIIQPPQPATIQCGMMTTEQMVLGSTPGLEMYTDQSGGMYLASQPMFIGLETIVSNTVMSSSQFVSAAMPGVVAASSSFSATTTQVFQASKLEPIMDVPSGFVIVNPHAPLSDPGLRNTGVITCTPRPSIPMSLPSPMTNPHTTPVISQPATTSAPNISWRYTPEYNMDPYVPINKDYESRQYLQMPSQVSPPNYPNEHCHYMPYCRKPVPLQSPPPIVNNVTPHVCEQSLLNQIQFLKPGIAPTTISTQVGHTQHVEPPQIQQVPRPMETMIVEFKEDQETVHKSTPAVDTRQVTIPIIQNKTTTNIKPNPLKLVFQKQSQDGFYKISNHNHNTKLSGNVKPVPITVQPVGLKCTKPKPRITSGVEKRKDDLNQYIPLVLQTNQNENVPNGTTNGTKLVQNGKLTIGLESVAKDHSPTITYEIRSQDGFSCSSSSITEVWQKVFEAVQEARMVHKMPPLPQNPFSGSQAGLEMLGLKHNGLRYLVEQLPGVGRCLKYKPRYHKLHPPSPEDDVDALPPENLKGSARLEPFSGRSPYDMFSWLASRHRQPPKFIVPTDSESTMGNRRATSSNLPMAMRFRHLKETSKEAVGVYRSHIHGRGLFCLRDIEAGEMVIEYAGEVIRSTLTDKREKLYESKGIGCYMFRIDDQLVVDATMRGNAARFINHSCEPNCYSRVVDILGKKHILIFALRRIPQGEELTYDYKFPFEDVKIPCTCGSRRCRKYLN